MVLSQVTGNPLNAGAKRSGATCHMAMPQCCYLAKGAKRPSHTINTIKFDRIPFDPCNSIKRFDLCPFDQKNSTYLQPPSSFLGLFDVPKTKKVGSESNFFVRSTRAANALISLKVLDFSMSLQHFKLVLRNFLLSKISNFDISNSCSLLIKCYCSFCRS